MNIREKMGLGFFILCVAGVVVKTGIEHDIFALLAGISFFIFVYPKQKE